MSDHGTQPVVVRTGRGLSVSGTRITLYDVMDYLRADWPPKLIRDWLNLTDAEIEGVMAYIAEHREEVEAEYEEVLQEAAANRAYWEERNRERIAEIRKLPPPPGMEAAYAKLQELRARLGIE
jgi:uncharacterized protein (DUF433 family)